MQILQMLFLRHMRAQLASLMTTLAAALAALSILLSAAYASTEEFELDCNTGAYMHLADHGSHVRPHPEGEEDDHAIHDTAHCEPASGMTVAPEFAASRILGVIESSLRGGGDADRRDLFTALGLQRPPDA